MHRYGKINLDDLMSDRAYSPVTSYNQTKLATLMFARELQRRAELNNWRLMSVAAHPGVARTDLTKGRPGQETLGLNRLINLISPLYAGSAANGALPSLYAATASGVMPGGYYGPTGVGEIKGPPGVARSTPSSLDTEMASAIWTRAERYTGLRFEES
jgi:NAD(P)-dependent dehydrogenase (short-subunit alcohol dehydrogenase family)